MNLNCLVWANLKVIIMCFIFFPPILKKHLPRKYEHLKYEHENSFCLNADPANKLLL